MSLTGGILAGVGLAGSAASAIGSSKAASTSANAANNAAALENQAANRSLDFQQQQYQNSLRMLNPYLQTGYGALGMLRTGLGIGGPMPQGFDPFASNTNSVPSGGFNAGNIGNLADLRAQLRGGGDTGQFRPMTAYGGQVPISSAASMAPGSDFGVNPAFDPNDPSQASAGTGQVPFTGNPDAHNFGGGTIDATKGNLQVPRADGTDASGNPNISFGSLLSPFSEQFKAPTVTDDPGYQFRLGQGLDAITNSAAARGGLVTGGTARALNDYAQGSASQEYQNAYNRSLNEYLNRANLFFTNQGNQFNKLADISGMGQTTAGQLTNAGLTAGSNINNTLLTSAGQIGQDIQNAGNARASGYQNLGNAIGNGIGSIGNLAMLNFLNGKGYFG